jgi:endonuclease/exonuclease/phosphatase family metal-dependent hydrolase
VNFTNNYAEQRIVAGDFNGWPGTAEINEMLRTHYDGWAVARTDGTAVAYPSNPDGNTRNSRIDFVFHSRGASALQVTRAQVYDTRDSSGHRPSDHNPLMVTYRVN